jgi:lysophospholipid acyltransferase (LPLAT)-like uncharacterized protein
MKKHLSESLWFHLVPFLSAMVIRLLAFSMRLEILGEERPRDFWQRGENLIFAFWHDQLMLMVKCYRGPGAKILISSSKDGEIIARVMNRFGLGSVRGSSTRGGRAAFREMVALGREAVDLVFTPDGPRGPRHRLKEGVVQLARITRRPVIPVAFACSRGYRFGSWDRFLLPFPFSRGVFIFDAPLSYEKGESPKRFQSRLQDAMEAAEGKAAARLEMYGVSAV